MLEPEPHRLRRWSPLSAAYSARGEGALRPGLSCMQRHVSCAHAEPGHQVAVILRRADADRVGKARYSPAIPADCRRPAESSPQRRCSSGVTGGADLPDPGRCRMPCRAAVGHASPPSPAAGRPLSAKHATNRGPAPPPFAARAQAQRRRASVSRDHRRGSLGRPRLAHRSEGGDHGFANGTAGPTACLGRRTTT
jgi:hypothetical protein